MKYHTHICIIETPLSSQFHHMLTRSAMTRISQKFKPVPADEILMYITNTTTPLYMYGLSLGHFILISQLETVEPNDPKHYIVAMLGGSDYTSSVLNLYEFKSNASTSGNFTAMDMHDVCSYINGLHV